MFKLFLLCMLSAFGVFESGLVFCDSGSSACGLFCNKNDMDSFLMPATELDFPKDMEIIVDSRSLFVRLAITQKEEFSVYFDHHLIDNFYLSSMKEGYAPFLSVNFDITTDCRKAAGLTMSFFKINDLEEEGPCINFIERNCVFDVSKDEEILFLPSGRSFDKMSNLKWHKEKFVTRVSSKIFDLVPDHSKVVEFVNDKFQIVEKPLIISGIDYGIKKISKYLWPFELFLSCAKCKKL